MADTDPLIRRRWLGAELRKLRESKGIKSAEAAALLMVSQPKISLLENGHRRINPRDVRDLCRIYGVQDQQVIDALMCEASESCPAGAPR
ncbi:helix-turn-helix transcriptional regulator [Streptomyces sp. H27-H1]|uniref:helix-turn-helix domain-containing protein n=1 Tax=Streptomyces sp. H27-H1 TaxID=2996461 RepID=UPI002271865C|nr:helix-turn-helix transcriptional regulator [Streptomyces sp. H27-H1]MCY0927918.1 helix-turn-helix transcriptional regulator [Streptomyces sp. H27-H1]